MRILLALLVSALALQSAETWHSGALDVTVDDAGRVVLKQGKTVVLNYDQLQLVATKPAWRGVYGFGTSKKVQMARRNDRCRVSEAVPKGMSYQRYLKLIPDGVAWDLVWAYPSKTGATHCYYFLDIPAALVDGAPCEFTTTEGTRMGALPANCGEMVGLSSIAVYGKGLKLDFQLSGTRVVWKMTDWSGSQHKSYRLRIESSAEAGGKAKASVAVKVSSCTAETVATLHAEWQKKEEAERQKRMAKQGILSREALTLGKPRMGLVTARRGRRLDFFVPLTATFENPYDPDDVALDAEFIRPDGTTDRVPGFFDLQERLTKPGHFLGFGKPVWRVRYTPVMAGKYQYRVTVRDRSGSIQSAPAEFTCTEAPFAGFVRVSKKQPYAYEMDDGTPYLPIGINVFDMARLGAPFPEDRARKLADQIKHLADAKGTFIRLRMDSWWLSIEGKPDSGLGHLGPGFYNQRVCDEIDKLMGLCEDRNIKVMLCLYNANGMVNGSVRKGGPTEWRRPYAFFLKDNGGPCEDRYGFWTDPTVKKWVRMKLRYSVARWGASPSLMCWEFWNELVFEKKVAKEQVAWHDEMGRYLRRIDPWKHPITNSLMKKDLENQGPMWDLPEMDIVQVHSYRGTELPVYMAHVMGLSHKLWKKPFFFGEYGIIHEDRSQGTYPYDPDGVHMHNGLWAPTMAGGAPGAFWFVSGYIAKEYLWERYTVLADWIADLPWTDPSLRSVHVAGFRYATPPALADGPIAGTPTQPFAKAEVDHFVVDSETGTVSDPGWFQSMLHMRDERKSCPTLVLDCAGDAVLEIRVTTSVGNETNKLVVNVDGADPLTKAFPAGKDLGTSSTYIEQYENWRTSYDETVEIPLPAGKHEVRLEGVGKDRLELRLSLRNYFRVPPVVVMGRRTNDAAWIWARHRMSTAYNLRAGKTWKPATGVVCELGGFQAGTYDVEWTDLWGGIVSRHTIEATGGALALPVPPVKRDLAAKVWRK